MRLTTAGQPVGFRAPVVGEITTCLTGTAEDVRRRKVYVGPLSRSLAELKGYRAALSLDGAEVAEEVFRTTGVPVIHSIRHIDHLRDGDVLAINPGNGFVRTVYRPDSEHNILFATERCNSNCLMCSQPPKDVDDTEYLFDANLEILKYISPATSYLTMTGGEPTLLQHRLFELLTEAKHRLP